MKFKEVKQLLNERARGITSRKSGDVFQDRFGKNIKMEKVVTFPEAGQYPSLEDLDAALNNWVDENGIEIIWHNTQTSATKAAIVSLFRNETNKIEAFGRYFRTIPPILDGLWPNTIFAKDTGYQLQRDVSIKETLPLKPTNLVGTDRVMSIQNLIPLMRSNIRNLDVTDELKVMLDSAMVQISARSLPTIKGGAQYATVFENYLGEVLAPIALIKNVGVTGQYNDAETALLKPYGLSFNRMNVIFPMTVTEYLIDSELVSPDGKVIVGISSKAATGGGAAASLKGLYNVIQDLDSDTLIKYRRVIEFIRLVTESSQKMGPILVGHNLGLISSSQAEELVRLVDSKTKSAEGVSPDLLKFAEYIVANTTRPSYAVGYHVLAGLAHTIAKLYNDDPIFDEAIRALLNRRSMIQVYSKVQVSGDDLNFSEFRVVYPPNFIGKVEVDAKKVYFSTGINGKFAFKFKT